MRECLSLGWNLIRGQQTSTRSVKWACVSIFDAENLGSSVSQEGVDPVMPTSHGKAWEYDVLEDCKASWQCTSNWPSLGNSYDGPDSWDQMAELKTSKGNSIQQFSGKNVGIKIKRKTQARFLTFYFTCAIAFSPLKKKKNNPVFHRFKYNYISHGLSGLSRALYIEQNELGGLSHLFS